MELGSVSSSLGAQEAVSGHLSLKREGAAIDSLDSPGEEIP